MYIKYLIKTYLQNTTAKAHQRAEHITQLYPMKSLFEYPERGILFFSKKSQKIQKKC